MSGAPVVRAGSHFLASWWEYRAREGPEQVSGWQENRAEANAKALEE